MLKFCAMKADLIIFDLDGTLVNSIPDLTDSLNFVSNLRNHKRFTEDGVKSIVGGGVSKLIEDAFEINKNDEEFQEVLSQFLLFYRNNHSNRSHLYNNVREVLEYFKAKKLAILSNKLDIFTKQIVKDFGIDKYFDLVLGATDSIAKKPSAEPIKFILNKINITFDNAIMVGDSEPDIMCATNAGIASVSVTYGYRSKEQLKANSPDFIIDDLTELKTIIE